ncbi:MFS transporter [Lactobacillus mulieris]|uniref:MFS transporter n=1 Tax=Lactobacillus mulieris TaxID=2508708 RepID=UPI0014332685|nr:MFS transporter [Lactobacillus mulieris]MCF1783594.1 MFS transporter [Lactobacillus mulieris]MCW8104318.1 MFS transporter [Lactobacillus mulieris]MDK6803556.1 MFS transporter [Lactobacillus mulieris]MDK8382745.1 MFS transporter [Lactobacillus mulieris]MDT9620856.1 MFS transporter [Lactobacillus mulieris]
MDKAEKAVDPKIKKLLLSLFVLFIMTNLMVQAFVTASPLIAKSFKITASLSSMQSTITTLAMGVGSVIFGTLSDYIPARKLLLFGVTLISVGSIIGFAFQSFYVSIIIARALQSLGQATISSLVIVIISRYISGKAKVRYFAYYTGCFQVAQSAGVLIGGLITAYVPWQVLLLLPLVAIFFLPIILTCAPNDNGGTKQHVDFMGLSMFAVTIILSILFVNSLTMGYLVGILVLLAIFLFYISKNNKAFITPQFFKQNRSFPRAILITVGIYCGQFAYTFLTTFIVSYGYHQSLSNVSAIFLPAYIASAVAGILGGDKFLKILGQEKTIILGMIMMTAGFLVAGLLINLGSVVLSIGAVLYFVGNTIMYSPLLDTVTGVIPKSEIGRGAGMFDLSINISGSLGVAISGKLISTKAFDGFNFFHANVGLVTFQNIFLVFALIALITIVTYFACQNKFEAAMKANA